jgi:hypothetical protein
MKKRQDRSKRQPSRLPPPLARVKLGVYRHYRNGKLYTVILNTVAHHDIEGRPVPRVVYVGHYRAADGSSRPYDCTAAHFLEKVMVAGKPMRRFTPVGRP